MTIPASLFRISFVSIDGQRQMGTIIVLWRLKAFIIIFIQSTLLCVPMRDNRESGEPSWEEYISSLCSFEMLIESLFYKNVMHHYALSSNIFCNGLFESHLASTETCEIVFTQRLTKNPLVDKIRIWILAPKTGQNCIYTRRLTKDPLWTKLELRFLAQLFKFHLKLKHKIIKKWWWPSYQNLDNLNFPHFFSFCLSINL